MPAKTLLYNLNLPANRVSDPGGAGAVNTALGVAMGAGELEYNQAALLGAGARAAVHDLTDPINRVNLAKAVSLDINPLTDGGWGFAITAAEFDALNDGTLVEGLDVHATAVLLAHLRTVKGAALDAGVDWLANNPAAIAAIAAVD